MNSQSKILYVHVPKAGGSAINAYFEERLGKSDCLAHAENLLTKPNPDHGKIRGYRYISAHLVYPNLRKQVDKGSRFVMTVLRSPMEQLVSHIAWMRFQTEPEQRSAYRGLPDHVKAISDQLSKFDPSNADALERFLSDLDVNQMAFFDNCQTRYLLPQIKGPVPPGLLRRAKSNLAALDFVGINERMQDVFDWLSYKLRLSPADASLNVNQSKRKYGLDVGDPAIRKVLRPFTALDQDLYELAQSLFGARIYQMWFDEDVAGHKIIKRDLLHKIIKKRMEQER